MRHGTRAAWDAGCRCDGCRLCTLLDDRPVIHRERAVRRPPNAYEALLPAAPYTKVIRALLDGGATARQLAEITGLSMTAIRLLDRGATLWVYPATAEGIRRLLPLLQSEKAPA
jgi:hypothetical protein